MDAQQRARLRELLAQYPPVWHAGRTVALTLYKGEGGKDDFIGMMMTDELADLVVLLHTYAREQLLMEGG